MTTRFHYGIDPAYAKCGVCILPEHGDTPEMVGIIETDKKLTQNQRIHELSKDLRWLLAQYPPASAGVEQLFIKAVTAQMLEVFAARGALLLVLLDALPQDSVIHWPPASWRAAFCGNGRADKKEVADVVEGVFGFRPTPDDASDAAGIAIAQRQMMLTRG